MIRNATLALLAVGLTAGLAQAQFVIVESRPRVVTYSPPPVYLSAPLVRYSSPVVYSSPFVTYSSPVVTYSSPIFSSAPLVSYAYYPPASTTVYSAPGAVVIPGVVTTRSYVGLGIFRPRGVYTETYFVPR